MVYKPEHKSLGLTISVSTDRKHGNGGVGGGRKSSSGKKATISCDGTPDVVLRGSTKKDLLRKIRSQFGIPSNVKINDSGGTNI